MSNNSTLPSLGRIVFTGMLSALIMILLLSYYEYKNEFTWFKAFIFGFLWLSSLAFLIIRVRKAKTENLNFKKPTSTFEAVNYSLKLMGGLKGIFKWSLITTAIVILVIITKVLIERQI